MDVDQTAGLKSYRVAVDAYPVEYSDHSTDTEYEEADEATNLTNGQGGLTPETHFNEVSRRMYDPVTVTRFLQEQ